MSDICQTRYPDALRVARPLPGIAPLAPDGWIETDEAYGAQMARRETLIKDQRDQVLAYSDESLDARVEVLALALELLRTRAGYSVSQRSVSSPDGRIVDLSGEPLETLGQLIQEDICILEKPAGGSEHVLSAACLCFPASWMLSEKIARPMVAIHEPVDEYDDLIARRVQRLFDGVQVGRPLWRFNQLWYLDAELHQPRSAFARSEDVTDRQRNFLRMEKQSLVRLPKTRAVVFSIHTFVLKRENVPEDIAISRA